MASPEETCKPHASSSRKLERLHRTGTRVQDGQLVNMFDQPSGLGKPACAEDERKKHREFTEEDDAALFGLLAAAEKEGLDQGDKIFQQLESMLPQHTWQAYQNRHRRAKQPAQTLGPEPYEAPWPNLYDDLGADHSHSTEQPTAAGSPKGVVPDEAMRDQSYFRVDSISNVCKKLGVSGDGELGRLLRDGHLNTLIQAYRRHLLMDERSHEEARVRGGQPVTKNTPGRSPHEWKTSTVLAELAKSRSRFDTLSPDTSRWTADDHDVWFMVRVCLDAQANKGPWKELGPRENRQELCGRAFWLLTWLRWLHKPSAGVGTEAHRLQRVKQEWLKRLGSVDSPGGGFDLPGPMTIPFRSAEPPLSQYSDDSDIDARFGPDEDGEWPESLPTGEDLPRPGNPSRQETTSRTAIPVSISRLKQPAQNLQSSTQRQQPRGLYWLEDDAHQMFINHQTKRLESWGVTSQHTGTCILVPEAWSHIAPFDIASKFDVDDPVLDETTENRLHFGYGDMTTAWARAAVWFNEWPRSPSELEVLTAKKGGPHTLMHASHLCHHGFCINPNHIVYEPAHVNFSRSACMFAARVLRAYGFPVPEHCNKHPDLPCMMQHAALTTKEAFLLQLHVLKTAAKEQNEQYPSYPRPEDHPKHYTTFEIKTPLEMYAPTVHTNPDFLVTPRRTLDILSDTAAKFQTGCHVCRDARRLWTRPTAAWAHVLVHHSSEPVVVRVAEIRRIAESYSAWADERFYHLETHNPQTWAKIQQTRSPDFCWEQVESWRLHEARFYQRRQKTTKGDFAELWKLE